MLHSSTFYQDITGEETFIHDLKTKIHNHATYKQSTQISTEHGVITSKPVHDLKTKIHNHATYKQSTQISTEHGVITSKPDLY